MDVLTHSDWNDALNEFELARNGGIPRAAVAWYKWAGDRLGLLVREPKKGPAISIAAWRHATDPQISYHKVGYHEEEMSLREARHFKCYHGQDRQVFLMKEANKLYEKGLSHV